MGGRDEFIAGGLEDEDFRGGSGSGSQGETTERGFRVPVVAQKRGEVAVGKPLLGVQGQEHGADAEEGSFEYDSVDGWARGEVVVAGVSRRRGGGGEGDASAEALTPEYEPCGGRRGVGVSGVSEDGLGVEDEARLRGPAGGGPVPAVREGEDGIDCWRRW